MENCETSAIGRALGVLGIGIETSIASANEVKDAIAKQSATKKPKKESSVDDDYQKAVDYLKKSDDKMDSWSKIEKQSKTKFNDEQYNRLAEYAKS